MSFASVLISCVSSILFCCAFLLVTGILQTEDGGDARALAKLFMRIDANSDGTVSWDEFSSYMLLESQGSASIREFEVGR